MKSFFLICGAFAFCICSTPLLRGQTDADVTATAQFSNGETVVWTDLSDAVGVQPGDCINVTVQLPTSLAGNAFDISALDGSDVADSPKAVGSDGTLSFAFRATTNPGTNRINLRSGPMRVLLNFWVLNLQDPQNNPPVITPANQGN